ncbi:MAG: response regulator [Sulfurimonas sp.]|nr:response regulator [Sulfurimonas sp.]MDD3060505.1 response regulator [Sulfurimonas sp.]MDD5202523.1 response regulator [Sulfurimonas sp.]
MQSILQMIKEDARNIHLLIAEDEPLMQDFYKKTFDGIFRTISIKNSAAEAYSYFNEQKSKPVDLLITGHHMPYLDGLALTEKIRQKDTGVQIIVITEAEDCALLKNFMLYGIAALLPKSDDVMAMMLALQRTLHNITERKLLEFYVNQLEAMARENVARKSEALKQKNTQELRTPKLTKMYDKRSETPKREDSLVDKYMIRGSVKDMENVDVDELDIIGHERIEIFRDDISNYESALCTVDHKNIPALRLVLHDVLDGVRELVRAINVMGVFPIAASAATNLISFVENLENSQLQDDDKRELFIDILVSMLADFDKWIDLVFISKSTQNIHYFDASFANTCLELEMIFSTNAGAKSDEDTLEFF